MSTNLVNSSVLLQWDAPLNTGGEKIDHYIIFFAELPSNTLPIQIETEENVFVINAGLNREYNVSVQAVNCHGEGPPLFITVQTQIGNQVYILMSLITFLFIITCLVMTLIVCWKIRKHQSKVITCEEI